MLESLHLKNVGPAPEMEMELAPRLNLITGDNGLGKSFLLDVAWWALTRKWPHDLNADLTSGYAARPTDVKEAATIAFKVRGKAGASVGYESRYAARDQAWLGRPGRPWNPGLVIYALADGGFAVWDPARNYWKKADPGGVDTQDRVPAYVFSSNEVWEGLRVVIGDAPTLVCNGLVADWASWIRERGADAERMAAVLGVLAGDARLEAGAAFARLSVNDARDIPTVRMGYGRDVPILYASLGVRRVAALAYMLTWAWREHMIAAAQLGEEPTSRVVLLFDELEAHLHPRWQRSILASMLQLPVALHDGAMLQIVATTHAPLVLASAESVFDTARDAWFGLDLDLSTSRVDLRRRELFPHGDVSTWLASDAFDVKGARPIEGEAAIERASRARPEGPRNTP